MSDADDTSTIASNLICDGYYSTSNAYRTIARLPDNTSALDALKVTSPDDYARIMRIAEQSARGTYLRRFAEQRTISARLFQAFKRLGGPVA